MALGAFIAGRYSTTWDPPGVVAAADLGLMRQGYELSWNTAVEAINQTDAYGDMFIDGVYRGISSCALQSEALEYKASTLSAITPWSTLAPTGASALTPGVIARLMSDVAGVVIATATAATPAASSPATLTATYTILQEGFDIRLLLDSKLRYVPIRFRILPYDDSGTITFFTTT